ncbi:MAG: CBS domain-containing protein [Saprospiraceae bacterium]|jgi:signal-transduction protein with cAMP-binding, CBS, and nucleotidyltransferase domain|nr:CBS domain-containing protein [Saprospiraceae bacterium]
MNKYLTAKDIASDKLYYIDGLSNVHDAILMMKKHDTDVLIIEKRDEKDANGIIVIADIIRQVIIKDRNPIDVSVYEIMNKPAISIPSTLNAKYVPRLLVNAKISVAPVEENGRYLGVIHLKDYLFNSVE